MCDPQRVVPPVGFEPTTYGLKVHCANQTAPRRRAERTGRRSRDGHVYSASSVGIVQGVNESEETPVETAPAESDAPSEAPDPATSVDLANRPEAAWLDTVEGEVEDVDLVLKCLARDNATICTSCHELQENGSLDARPVLARCASTKQPR